MNSKWGLVLISAFFVLGISVFFGAAEDHAARAQEKKTEGPPPTPEELAETAHRKKCKIKICDAFVNKVAAGPDIACDVTKTWHKDKIELKYLKNKISWPWGKARCKADISLARASLVKAMTEAEYEIQLAKHAVSCELFQKDGKDKYDISFSIEPKVTWKNAKATKAALNMADIKGSAIAKSGLWTIAKVNSYFGVLDGPLVEKINEFIAKDCKELNAEHASQ